jgi:LytS/YehU family sensor histidine kinase
MQLLEHTLKALVGQRRMLPIIVVCVPLVMLEFRFSGFRGASMAVSTLVGFLLMGPVSYRALFPEHVSTHRLARVVAFAVVDLLYVALIGRVLPPLLQAENALFAESLSLYTAAPLFWAGSWALGRDIESEASLHAAHARNAELVREAERAQLLALRAHLDPHFLFNTLNAIAEWCRDDPAVAERATLQLSSMLRTILSGVKASAWPLREELELVRQLLELHKTRDPQRIVFEIHVEIAAEPVSVPPMMVLSLVENAIKHGPAAGHVGTIEITAQLRAERLQVRIRNPGVYRGRREGGEGLATVEKRLALAYDGRASMLISSDDATTTVALDLPIAPNGESA